MSFNSKHKITYLFFSFRSCRGECHIPYRCDEIEKAPEVEIRTMIENKMSEALIR